MLVLICNTCQEKSCSYVCELCRKSGKVLLPDDMSNETSETVARDVDSDPNQARFSPLLPHSIDQNIFLTKSTRKLRVLCLHGFRQNASSFKGRTASLAKKLKNIAEFVFVDAPNELPFIYQHPLPDLISEPIPSQQSPPSNNCNRKFAWLVASDYDAETDAEWKMAKTAFDTLQYQQQTKGFEKSIEYLNTIFSQKRPFDGIMGFSQGAAMAALLGARKEKFKEKKEFRFVILCSGFPVNMEEFGEGSINCPSLHIFGSKEDKDRQIDCQARKQLASLFESGCSVVIEHELGHIIPTRSPYIDEMKAFLNRFH